MSSLIYVYMCIYATKFDYDARSIFNGFRRKYKYSHTISDENKHSGYNGKSSIHKQTQSTRIQWNGGAVFAFLKDFN